MNTQITTTQSLGKRQYEYDIEASATIQHHPHYGSDFDDYEINILRKGKMLTGKRYDVVMKHLDLGDIDDLLIESYEG